MRIFSLLPSTLLLLALVPAAASQPTFSWPIVQPNPTANGYARYDYVVADEYHTGIDLTSTVGDRRVLAADGGVVEVFPLGTYYNENHGMGRVVVIDHGNGFHTLYAHLASFAVSDGQTVGRGQEIGTYGSSGCDTGSNPCGAHLHFEVKHWPVLGNLHSDFGPEWGYTPAHPNLAGYLNPYPFLDHGTSLGSGSVVQASASQALKTGPGSEYSQEIATVVGGQSFASLARYGSWRLVYVTSEDGVAAGWIRASDASGTVATVDDPQRGTTGVNVRSGPGTSYSDVSDVWDTQRFPVLSESSAGAGCSDSWYEIPLASNASGSSGWVCGEFLDVAGVGGCPDCGGSGPDLRISNAELSESSVGPGDDLRIDVTVLNDGDGVAPRSRARYYWSDDADFDDSDTEVENDRVRELDPQEEDDENETFPVPDVSPGTYYVITVADADDEVDESNEGNNVASVSVSVGGGGSDLPNLIVDSIDAPSSVEAGEELDFDFVVAELNDPDDFNQLVNGVPFDMEYFLIDGSDRILVGDRTNPTSVLWPRSREREFGGRADIPANLSPGTYEIVVEVDADEEVAESDENDNDRSFFVEVSGGGSDLPNLLVQSVEAPSSVEAGDELDFDFVVAELNDPDDFAQSVRQVPFDMEYFLLDGSDRVLVGDRTNPTGVLWPADREREYSGRADIPADLSPGTYQIVVEVDTEDEVEESNEDDNERTFSVEVTASSQAEISFSASSLSFGAVQVGQNSDIGFNVSNTGTAPLTFSASVTGPGFSLAAGAGTITVQPSSSHGITIRFQPGSEGAFAGALQITHDAPNMGSPAEIPLGGTGQGTGNLADLTLPDVMGAVGQQLRVPIDLSGLDGREVLAYQFELTHDPAVVDFLSVETAGTLSAGWNVTTNEPNAGEVVISGANARAFTSNGVLLYLVYDLIGDGTSTLDWRSGRLNEGDPPTMVSRGSITVANCLCGDVTGNGDVSPFDASYILQYSVGIQPPTFLLCAADPTQNNEVSPLDASYILQYTVGSRSDLVCGSPSASVAAVATPPASAVVEGTSSPADWDAASSGSGIWTVDLSLGGPALSAMLDLEVKGDVTITLPEGTLPEGWVSYVVSTERGVRVAMAGPEPMPADWKVALQVASSGVEGASVSGTLAVDERSASDLSSLSLVETPEELALTFVFPNPTNARASVSLSLPETSKVRVELVDVLGRLVSVVDDRQLDAGTHTLRVPTQGLAPGRYFLTVTTDDGRIARPFSVAR